MVPVFLSLGWDMFPASGLFSAVIASWIAILLAEWSLLTKLRQRVVIVGTLISLLFVQFVCWWLLNGRLWNAMLSPVTVLQVHLMCASGPGVGAIVLGLRLMAKKSRVWFFIEMAIIAFSTAIIFFPHQYKIVIRPLWLSDLAWSVGLEPSVALGLVGVILASLLSVLTVLDRSRRMHISVILLPLLSLLALIFVDP